MGIDVDTYSEALQSSFKASVSLGLILLVPTSSVESVYCLCVCPVLKTVWMLGRLCVLANTPWRRDYLADTPLAWFATVINEFMPVHTLKAEWSVFLVQSLLFCFFLKMLFVPACLKTFFSLLNKLWLCLEVWQYCCNQLQHTQFMTFL